MQPPHLLNTSFVLAGCATGPVADFVTDFDLFQCTVDVRPVGTRCEGRCQQGFGSVIATCFVEGKWRLDNTCQLGESVRGAKFIDSLRENTG